MSRRGAMKIHSYEAGTTQEHILYERRLDHESILLRSGRARGGSREERHTESKIRWWGLCANPDPYPFGSITESKIRCWGLCVNECSLHYPFGVKRRTRKAGPCSKRPSPDGGCVSSARKIKNDRLITRRTMPCDGRKRLK